MTEPTPKRVYPGPDSTDADFLSALASVPASSLQPKSTKGEATSSNSEATWSPKMDLFSTSSSSYLEQPPHGALMAALQSTSTTPIPNSFSSEFPNQQAGASSSVGTRGHRSAAHGSANDSAAVQNGSLWPPLGLSQEMPLNGTHHMMQEQHLAAMRHLAASNSSQPRLMGGGGIQSVGMNGLPGGTGMPVPSLNGMARQQSIAQGPASGMPMKSEAVTSQLRLLLHAHECDRRCNEPMCGLFKSVLEHMKICNMHTGCSYAHCSSSRQIVQHFKDCRQDACAVCRPFKGKRDRRIQMHPSSMTQQQQLHPTQAMRTTNGKVSAIRDEALVKRICPLAPTASQSWHDTYSSTARVRNIIKGLRQMSSADFDSDRGSSQHEILNLLLEIERKAFSLSPSVTAYVETHAQNCVNLQRQFEHKKSLFRKRVQGGGTATNTNNGLHAGAVSCPLPAGSEAATASQVTPVVKEELPSVAATGEQVMDCAATATLADGFPKMEPLIADPALSAPSTESAAAVGNTGAAAAIAEQSGPTSLAASGLEDNKLAIAAGGATCTGVAAGTSSLSSPVSSVCDKNSLLTLAAVPMLSTPVAMDTTEPSEEAKRSFQDCGNAVPKTSMLPPLAISPNEPPTPVSSTGEVTAGAAVTEEMPAPVQPPTSLAIKPGEISVDDQTLSQLTAPAATPSVVPKPLPAQKAPKLVFENELLVSELLPVWSTIHSIPDSDAFHQPVDPARDCAPDYLKIVKHPMDLGTMRKKLEDGEYKYPFQFIDDFHQMCDNALLFNKKYNKLWRLAKKMIDMFDRIIDEPLQRLGYCCGRRRRFAPKIQHCYGKQTCTVQRDCVYYTYSTQFMTYYYCKKCFDGCGAQISLGEETGMVKKTEFTEGKNNQYTPEPFCLCIKCNRQFHETCVGHHSRIWPEGFTCDACLSRLGSTRRENTNSIEDLDRCVLSDFLETKVNDVLSASGLSPAPGKVYIRVLSSADKTVEIKAGMKEKFGADIQDLPYRSKAIFAFQKQSDGQCICFFGMHVQEYGSDCPAPNTRRVYLSYLDSCYFFEPRPLRTQVYYTLLISYFSYCKKMRFAYGHIWACPPTEGDDYIFNAHPMDQKTPKLTRLKDWYKVMLNIGVETGQLYEFKDILSACIEENVQCFMQLPYFEGDFIPNLGEDVVKDYNRDENERLAASTADSSQTNSKQPLKKSNTASKSKKPNNARNRAAKRIQATDEVSQRVFTNLEKHKDVFFSVRLCPAEDIPNLGPTEDPDPLIQCDLMDGRDAFLALCRDRMLEFSDRQRAIYSTTALAFELHNVSKQPFAFGQVQCDTCRNIVAGASWHCTDCPDFDQCITCHETVGHNHAMTQQGLVENLIQNPSTDAEATANTAAASSTAGKPNASTSSAASKASADIQPTQDKFIAAVRHVLQCQDTSSCNLPSCIQVRKILSHAQQCGKPQGTCRICRLCLFLFARHSRDCTKPAGLCPIPLCNELRVKRQKMLAKQRAQQERMVRSRMLCMSTATEQADTGRSTPSSVAAGRADDDSGVAGLGSSPSKTASPAKRHGKDQGDEQMDTSTSGDASGNSAPASSASAATHGKGGAFASRQSPSGSGLAKDTSSAAPLDQHTPLVNGITQSNSNSSSSASISGIRPGKGKACGSTSTISSQAGNGGTASTASNLIASANVGMGLSTSSSASPLPQSNIALLQAMQQQQPPRQHVFRNSPSPQVAAGLQQQLASVQSPASLHQQPVLQQPQSATAGGAASSGSAGHKDGTQLKNLLLKQKAINQASVNQTPLSSGAGTGTGNQLLAAAPSNVAAAASGHSSALQSLMHQSTPTDRSSQTLLAQQQQQQQLSPQQQQPQPQQQQVPQQLPPQKAQQPTTSQQKEQPRQQSQDEQGQQSLASTAPADAVPVDRQVTRSGRSVVRPARYNG
eukprot:scpid8584/ scgid27999/ Histone acetyltransferase p300; E1A-associated protein p300